MDLVFLLGLYWFAEYACLFGAVQWLLLQVTYVRASDK